MILKLIAVWGLADAAWLAINPGSWSAFWSKKVKRIGKRHALARGLAATELGMCAYLMSRKVVGRRQLPPASISSFPERPMATA